MEVLWQPSNSFVEQSNLSKYLAFLTEHYNLSFSDYEELWTWSVENTATFWTTIWKYFEIIDHGGYDEVVSSDAMPGAQWFSGSQLNYGEHLFRFENQARPALIFTNEKEDVITVSWVDLREQVEKLRFFLRSQGVTKGDCVAGYLPNIPSTVAAFIATSSLGAIWSCCSMDFGESTVIERFEQIRPKVLIAADGYYYKSRDFSRKTEIKRIADALPSVKCKIVIQHIDQDWSDEQWHRWTVIQSQSDSEKLVFQPVPFDHPLWILYSSGTTGKPKAITHSHGGVLLEHLKYLALHNDVKPGEHFFWFTTTGWMMWNFLQASLLVGAIPVLYEGSPAFPDLSILWRLADRLPIHHFGTSAPYLTALMNQSLPIGEKYNLTDLRSIGSTGAPLPPDAFEYIYQKISQRLWLCSMSGGTDVCTAFVGGVPHKPVIKGRIQGRALGAALYAYDDTGNKKTNQLGEMVIEKPMPSMPIYFWNDPDNERYLESYFGHFEGKWRHGDYIKIYDDGSLIIQGRSDATLNRKGIRIGTAEIYNVLNDIAEISDALVLNLEREKGDIMPLFVVLRERADLSDTLKEKINQKLREDCSPRHVPDLILTLPDIPYTLSGKKMEVPIKKLLMGMRSGDGVKQDAVRNPLAMDHIIKHLSEIRAQLDY